MEEALADGERAVELRPDWGKAHFRKGSALHALRRWEDAATAFFEGVQVDTENPALAKAFQDAIREGRREHQAGEARRKEEEEAAERAAKVAEKAEKAAARAEKASNGGGKGGGKKK